MSEASPKIPKPVLRGLHHATMKRNIGIALALSALVGLTVKTLYVDPKQRAYADFYANYDPDVAFERMKDAGLMQSVKD